jgi:hypothetical protein
MSDSFSSYLLRLRAQLGGTENISSERFADALLVPAFGFPVLFTVDETLLSLAWLSHDSEEPFGDIAAISPSQADGLWRAAEDLGSRLDQQPKHVPLDRSEEFDVWALPERGRDGTSFLVRFRIGSEAHEFERDCHITDPMERHFIRSIYQVAWQVLKDDMCVRALEQLHNSTCSEEAPVVLLEESVPRLRFFAVLSTQRQREISMVFNSIDTQDPLIVDLTQVVGMDTGLFALFRGKAKRRSQTAWVMTREQRPEFQAMRLDARCVFEDVASARAWLETQRAAGA